MMQSCGLWLLLLVGATVPSAFADAPDKVDMDIIEQFLESGDGKAALDVPAGAVLAMPVDAASGTSGGTAMVDASASSSTTAARRRRRRSESRRRRRSSRRRSPSRRRSSSRRRKSSSPPRRRTSSPRRRKSGSPSRPSPTPPPAGPPKDPEYSCTKSGKFDGDVKKFIGNNKFCGCGYNPGSGCSFICAGPGGGNCQGTTSCDEGVQSFDNKGVTGTWVLNIKKDGGPYRAFAYMLGMEKASGSKLSFSFKTKDHNTVYTKIFFWGDGNNILGIKPDGTFCFMPSGDAPLSQITCKGTAPMKDDTWYRVEMAFSGSNGVALVIDGKSIGSGTVQGFNNAPQLGCYHWSGNGGANLARPYQLHFRDMCLGTSKLTNR